MTFHVISGWPKLRVKMNIVVDTELSVMVIEDSIRLIDAFSPFKSVIDA